MPAIGFRTPAAAMRARDAAAKTLNQLEPIPTAGRCAETVTATPERPHLVVIAHHPDSAATRTVMTEITKLARESDATPLQVAERAFVIVTAGWKDPREIAESAWSRADDDTVKRRTVAEAVTRAWYELTGDAYANAHWLPAMRTLFTTIEHEFDTSKYLYEDTNLVTLLDAWNGDADRTFADVRRLFKEAIRRIKADPTGDV